MMAHPDDCEFLAAGTLALLVEKDWHIHIVTMTPGDCGSMNLGPIETAIVRQDEGKKAAKVIGATYHCLEFGDLKVVFGQETISRALQLTRKIAPSLVITHSLADYHLDHEETAKITRAAAFGFAIPNATTGYIPKGSALPHLYYADPIGGTDIYGTRISPTTYVDITSIMRTKTQALRAHSSQREWLLKYHGMDQYIESMQQFSAVRGQEIGVKYAESFRQNKGHPYPKYCLLTQQLDSIVTTRDC